SADGKISADAPANYLYQCDLATLSGLSVWANDGGDKVTREEHRGACDPLGMSNSVYKADRGDGKPQISLFGAKNEVVSFNLVIESMNADTSGVSVKFDTLSGSAGQITSAPATKADVFDWTNRNIELFYVRYLQILGLSRISYNPTYDERHVPARLRRPPVPNGAPGEAQGDWTSRPDHDKFYPDIAVPMEAVPNFTIAKNQNQSVWVDVYIPKNASGTYTGKVSVLVNGTSVSDIDVSLNVRNFTLPDKPTLKATAFMGYSEINSRYLNNPFPNDATPDAEASAAILQKHYMLAHRHKISLVDNNEGTQAPYTADAPRPQTVPALDGTLFTSVNGYAGPGTGTPNGVFSIGNNGNWSWQNGTQTDMQSHLGAWELWFATNAPGNDRFLFLIDGSTNFTQIDQWASWAQSSASGKVPSYASINPLSAISNTPSLSIAGSTFNFGVTSEWQSTLDSMHASGKQAFLIDANRPSSGSFATEDDGVALREMAWGQYKKKIDRWFYWESTYYDDSKNGAGPTDVYNTAQTFGGVASISTDPKLVSVGVGLTTTTYGNGSGVLFYPGTDKVKNAITYDLDGPIASLRLKHWRRGIQDVDYLALARAVNPAAADAIRDRMVPKALWEIGVDNPTDPTYCHTDISWSVNPDDWETARSQLADIIEGKAGN
ncbi:MAG: hypothetical protein ACXWP5_03260, partial [Bdellovibrionota bacterium]